MPDKLISSKSSGETNGRFDAYRAETGEINLDVHVFGGCTWATLGGRKLYDLAKRIVAEYEKEKGGA